MKNIVDYRLEQLISMGKLDDSSNRTYSEEFKFKIPNVYSQQYWDKFIKMCEDDIVDFVLSKPQPGNWNGYLYASCEKRRGLKPNR